MAENSEIQTSDNEVIDTSNAQETELASSAKTASFESSKDEFQKSPILPRTAWKSELTFLKTIFKVKQALDKREKAFMNK